MNEVLAEVLDEFDEATTPDGIADEAWYPTTDADFEWCQRKRLRAMARSEEIAALRDEQVAKLTAAFDRRIAQADADATRFTLLIETGVRKVEPDGKGKRSVKAPGVTAYIRHSQQFVWPEEGDLLAWAKDTDPTLVRVKESPDKTAIKAYVKETGDAPAGLLIQPTESVVIKEA